MFNACHGYVISFSLAMSVADQKGMYIWEALYFGREAAKKNYALQIKNIVQSSRDKLGEVPIIIGETGVPMDIK